jgi:L-alanine-DL-glutamate epimerase-like enolase superfamily enzyme
MKITAVQTYHIKIPYDYGAPAPTIFGRPWITCDTLLVRVDTDQGVTGWGEAFGYSIIESTRAALDTLVGPLLVGRDPTQIAPLMQEMQKRLHIFGRSGPCVYALSGIDIALWDIAGKVAGLPLHRLLGGSTKTHLPAYASLMRYSDPAAVARHTEAALKRGFRYIKLHEIGVDETVAGRDAAGDETPLMLDTNCPWTPTVAIEMARRLADVGLYWLEEPVWPPENHEGLADVRSNSGVPIAAGENVATLLEFKNLFELEAVDVAQPSVTKVGGITEVRRIMTLAEAYNVTVHPHSPYFGPGLLATLHLVAAAPQDMLVEHLYFDLEASLYGSAAAPFNGNVAVPQGAGLGFDPDLRVIERYRG